VINALGKLSFRFILKVKNKFYILPLVGMRRILISYIGGNSQKSKTTRKFRAVLQVAAQGGSLLSSTACCYDLSHVAKNQAITNH